MKHEHHGTVDTRGESLFEESDSSWEKSDFLLLNICLTLSKQALVFMCLQYKTFENTEGKEEIACDKQFILFPRCFLPVWRAFCYFH